LLAACALSARRDRVRPLSPSSSQMSGTQEVEAFLQEIGLESCIQAVVHNGFYTSMEALRGATYEELVDSGVRPVHAKLIISNLGSKQDYGNLAALGPAPDGGDEVGHFLRSVGLENCAAQLTTAGFTTLELLGEASMQDLLNAGLKPVHARLIISNLDSASTGGINMTPANHRLASLDAEESGGLLGDPQRKPRPRGRRLCIYGGVLVLLLLALSYFAGAGSKPTPALPAAPGETAAKPELKAGKGNKMAEGKHGKHGGGGGGGGGDIPHGKKAGKPM